LRNPPRGRLVRAVTVAAVTLAVCLAAGALAGGVVRSAVLGRLRDVDPGASVSSMRVAPGVVLLEDLELPSLGLRLESASVWWSLRPFSPEVDRLVLSDGCWNLDSPGDDRPHGSGGGRTLPEVRFSGVRILRGDDEVATVSGSLSGGPARRGCFLASGDWGQALGSFRLLDGPDSVMADWFRVSSGSERFSGLPGFLRGHEVEGSCRGEIAEHRADLDITVSSLDGEPVEAGFHVGVGEEGGGIAATLDLSGLRLPIERAACSVFGEGSFAVAPRGTLEIRLAEDDVLLLRADAVLDSLRLLHPLLSEDTVETSLAVRFEGTWRPGSWEVGIDSGSIGIGAAQFGFSLEGRLSPPRRLALRIWSPAVSGEAISQAVPAGMLGPLEGLRLGGEASVDVALVLDWGMPDSSDFSADIDVSGLEVLECPVSIWTYRTGGSCRMRDSWGGSRTILLDPVRNASFVPFGSLHPSLEGILECAEDGSFRSHHGFSELQIRNSIRENVASGAFVRGASTITMQLARNLMLDRDRNLARKLQEAFLTWRLEEGLGKDRILEIYCNIVELGPDVFGFQEGARYYFGTDLADLTTREVAYLVSILPGPSVYHRFYRDGAVPGWWDEYLDRLVTLAGRRGSIPADSVSAGLAGSIVFRGV